eukprot:COSAG01_NODE_10730_length_2093_cov_1.668506_4_plen_56_part_01
MADAWLLRRRPRSTCCWAASRLVGARALMGSKSRGKRAKGQGAKKALPDSGRTANF